MTDCIYRDEALELLKLIEYKESSINFAGVMIRELQDMPAADVSPVVRGRWISNRDGETVVQIKDGEPQESCFCSVCGEWLVASDEYDVKGNFCPNCGAKMEEN